VGEKPDRGENFGGTPKVHRGFQGGITSPSEGRKKGGQIGKEKDHVIMKKKNPEKKGCHNPRDKSNYIPKEALTTEEKTTQRRGKESG